MRWIVRELRDWWVGQRHPESMAFDRERGTDTAWFDLFNYEPSLPSVVASSLDALAIEPAEFTFVDLGSGKGRVVLIAAERGYVEVVGVEYRRRLHRAAVRNVAKLGPDCSPVRLECGDALAFGLPEGPLVLYLFNPFPPEGLAGVLARVQDRARLVYVHPVGAEVVEELGWEEVHRHEDADPVCSFRIYEGPWG